MQIYGNSRIRWSLGLLVVALGLIGTGVGGVSSLLAQQQEEAVSERGALDPLTPEEQAAAERISRSDNRVKQLIGEQRVRLVSATPVMIKRGESPEKVDVRQREIEVVLFRPEGEIGARVIVNLRQNAVTSVQRLASGQVQLTADDLKDAFQLAMRDAEVQRALGATAQSFHVETERTEPSENVVTGLPIRSNNPKDPCSKHRCLQLFFRRGADFLSEPVVTVDLTAKHVSVERRHSP